MRRTAVGLAIGVALAVFLGKLVDGLLFGVSGTDPMTLFVVTTGLAGAALVAGSIQARRVTHVPPAEPLRAE